MIKTATAVTGITTHRRAFGMGVSQEAIGGEDMRGGLAASVYAEPTKNKERTVTGPSLCAFTPLEDEVDC